MEASETQPDMLPTPLRHRNEPALRAAIVQVLRADGLRVEEQVTCAAGAADIATADRSVIIEVKHRLTRKALQQAAGQLLLYRTSLNPQARLIIVGYATPDTAPLRPHIEALGIEVRGWKDEGGEIRDEGGEMRDEGGAVSPSPLILPPSSFIPHPSALCWRLAEQAQAQGITSVRALSFRSRINRQSLYPIWKGQSQNISVRLFERLCRTLAADPGGWFRWADDTLAWNIRQITEARGLTIQDLVWAAEILPYSLSAIWRGEQQFVFVETLQKLARALELETGDLFAWQMIHDQG
jgi:DNA-binding Xre family transcriptional regulator